ncbi:HMCN [Mytilus edulis]|uniref:HMCN n=1 Tax=Mytilus edulis TaxID=6550 RepID=A0A8S3S2L0_MYTED|nr:HMCN [Mytilus edulis]
MGYTENVRDEAQTHLLAIINGRRVKLTPKDPKRYQEFYNGMRHITDSIVKLQPDHYERAKNSKERIRGGITVATQRYAKANNTYVEGFNADKPTNYLMYVDANNLYGWAMSKYVPTGGFECMYSEEMPTCDTLIAEDDKGFVLEVDLEYSKELYDNHNDYPLAPQALQLNMDRKMRQTYFFTLIIVLIQDIPNVLIEDGFIVDYGNTFTINCSIFATSQVSNVYWQKESNGMITTLEVGLAGTKGMTIDDPSLTINFASMTDSGMYTCSALNYVGIGKSKAANITVHGGIPMINTFKTNYTVVYGSSITMVCNVTAFPKLKHVSWQRNNSGILTILNKGAVGTDGITTNNPSLTIESTSFSDVGIYHCFASNIAGTKKSDAIHLSVLGGIPLVNIPLSNYSSNYGKEVTIECTVLALPKVKKIVWEKSVYGEITSINARTYGIRGSIVNNPSLTILNATITDSGDYTCFAENNVGIGKSQTTSLNVNGGIPAVRIETPVYSVIFGSKIYLHCEVTAEPEHTLVYWERNNNDVITTINSQATGTTGVTPNSPSLTLQFSSFSDKGAYTCVAANTIGIGKSHPTILAVSGGLPVATIRKSNYLANYGDTIVLECQVTSTPVHISIYWQKVSGGFVTNITAEYPGISGITLKNPSLTIKFVTTSDAGLYRCIAKNVIGIGNSKTCNVTVIADKPYTIVGKSSYTAFLGLSIEIKCTVQSVPTHTYVYWTHKRNDTRVVISPGTVGFDGMTVENPSLYIPKVDLFMSGDYSCIAINDIGTGTSLPTTLIIEVLNHDDTSVLSTSNYISAWQEETITNVISSKPFTEDVPVYKSSLEITQDMRLFTTPKSDISTEDMNTETNDQSDVVKEVYDVPPFPFLQEMNDIQINIEAARQRDLINDMWKKSLNERKIAYYNALRCDKNAEIYLKWQAMENPILPEKFLIREIKGEHCEETEIRGQLALQRLATEISLLQTRKHRFEEKFRSIDATVLAEISEKCKGNIEAKLHEMWTQDTKCEEEKSKLCGRNIKNISIITKRIMAMSP